MLMVNLSVKKIFKCSVRLSTLALQKGKHLTEQLRILQLLKTQKRIDTNKLLLDVQ